MKRVAVLFCLFPILSVPALGAVPAEEVLVDRDLVETDAMPSAANGASGGPRSPPYPGARRSPC